MEILQDDKIVIAGSSGDKPPADSDWGIWKFNSDGSPDGTFGNFGLVTTDITGEFDEALGIAVQDDGKLVTAGKFRMDNNINFGVARYENELAVSVPESIMNTDVMVSPNPAGKMNDIRLAFSIDEPKSIAVELIDLSGTVVFSKSLGHFKTGNINEVIRLTPNINSGIHFLRIKSPESLISTKKIMIIE
jgi:uncharacterized delta-60 repeat protein